MSETLEEMIEIAKESSKMIPSVTFHVDKNKSVLIKGQEVKMSLPDNFIEELVDGKHLENFLGFLD